MKFTLIGGNNMDLAALFLEETDEEQVEAFWESLRETVSAEDLRNFNAIMAKQQ